jgi:hypothetical protein
VIDMTSSVQLQQQAQVSRERLSRSLHELRRHLEPQNLIDEAFESVAGPEGVSVVKQMEGVIRQHPLPMMLISAGGVMWLTGGFKGFTGKGRTATEPAVEAAGTAAKSVKKNFLSMGHSFLDNAVEKIEERLSATLNDYANSATSGVEKVSERVTGSMRGVLDNIIEKVSTSMREHPLTSSVVVMALSTALGGKEPAKKAS